TMISPLNDATATQLFEHGVRVVATTSVMRTPDELYDAWHNLRDLPRISEDVEEVADLGDGRTRWKVRLPIGVFEWEAEIINDQEGRVIAWRTVEGASAPNAGSLRF